MTMLTPLIKVKLGDPSSEYDISGLKIRAISDEELREYFGITNREKEGTQTKWDSFGENIRMSSMNFMESSELIRSEVAAFSELSKSDHDSKIVTLNNSMSLLGFTGAWCPVTFNSDTPSVLSRSPFLLGERSTWILNDESVKELSVAVEKSKLIDNDNLELLRLTREHGVSELSVLFLVTILERLIMGGKKLEKTEISFKVSIFGAVVVAKQLEISELEVHRVLKDAYDVRSLFVHTHSKNTERLKLLFPKLYDYVIQVIWFKLEHPECLKPENRISLLLKG